MSALAARIAADPWLALLLQLAVIATAVAAVVLGAAHALRRATAPVRAAWLLAGVVTLLLLPCATVLARATTFGVALLPAADTIAEQPALQTKVGVAPPPATHGASGTALAAAPGPQPAAPSARTPTAGEATARTSTGAWLAIAWLAAAAVEALLQLRAAVAAARLRRRSRSATDPAALAEVAVLARELGLRTPRLCFSSELPCPATIGAIRPVVVLPQRWRAAPAAARAAVLRHELVHIGLRHPQQALLLALLRVLFAWHPLVRRVALRLAHVHEELADNGALAGGVEPLAYARTLLAFAAAARGLLRAPQALFAVGSSPLARRIERLTRTEPETMTTTTNKTRAAAALAAAALLLPAFAVRLLPQEPAAAGAATQTKAPDPRDPATYMPRARGTRWTWRANWTGDDGKPYEHVHYGEAFGEVPLGATGRTCTQLVFANNETCEYWSAGPDGLLQHDNAYIGGRGVAASGAMRWLAAPVGAVTRWEWDSQMGCQVEGGAAMPDPETLRVHHAAELVAFDETVTVPAGTFHCAHVRVTETNRDWPQPHTIELWFGRGVGVVRRVDSQIGTRELIAFAPGEPVGDREAALQQALAAAGTGNVFRRVEWLDHGEWCCHVHGDFAVVWQGEGAPPRCFHVDREAKAFALDDTAFWSARLAGEAEQFRWAAGEPNGRGGAQATFSFPKPGADQTTRLCEIAARLEALRAFGAAARRGHTNESRTFGQGASTFEIGYVIDSPDGGERQWHAIFAVQHGKLEKCEVGEGPPVSRSGG